MDIAVIGAGNVGATLGRRWSEAGHAVVFGVRNPADEKYSNMSGVATIADAIRDAEVVLLATPWHAAEAACNSAGDLSGKVVIDATNPLKADLSGLETSPDESGAQKIATWTKSTRVVKAFNTTGVDNMANPSYSGSPATMLVAGDDAEAKRTTMQLAADLGFEPFDAGPLAAAGMLESLALLWIHMAYRGGLGRDFAFNIVRR